MSPFLSRHITFTEWLHISVFIRPTEDHEIFSIIVSSKVFDLEALAKSRDALTECVHKLTDRKDITIGEIRWVTNWRYVILVCVC